MEPAPLDFSKPPADMRLHRLEALVAASMSLNHVAGLDELLQTILRLISAQLDCERATVFLTDLRTGKVHARQMSGSDHNEIVLERGRGIAGHVAEKGESLLINDVQSDPRFDRATDLRTGFTTRDMICVPLRKPDGGLMGSLQAINARAGQFSPADLEYLESFAALASVAVEREQLVREAFRAQLLSTELDLARNIQQRLLPSPGTVELPAPFSAWGTSQACFDVGGDTYDVVMLPSGECAFWVADVSGKGVGAALLMTTLQTELRVLVHKESDLARLATELNRKVHAVVPMGTYATLFIGVLSAEAERLRYVNAGHLPPIWIKGPSPEDTAFEVGGMPIGLLPNTLYEAGETRFGGGECLAVFSDGVTDTENTAGEIYGEEGLMSSLTRIDAHGVGQIGPAFFEELDNFRIGAPAKDDTTFLVIGLA